MNQYNTLQLMFPSSKNPGLYANGIWRNLIIKWYCETDKVDCEGKKKKKKKKKCQMDQIY